MNDFNDIENLWKQSAAPPLPSAREIREKAAASVRSMRSRLLLQTIALAAVVPFVIFILWKFDFAIWTTYAGVGLMVLCIVTTLWFRIKELKQLHALNFSAPPAELLKQLESYYQQQKWNNTVLSFAYSFVLNLAFLLYFYETLWLSNLSATVKIIFISAYVIWMIVATFFIGKRWAAKQERTINNMIDALKEEQAQLQAKD